MLRKPIVRPKNLSLKGGLSEDLIASLSNWIAGVERGTNLSVADVSVAKLLSLKNNPKGNASALVFKTEADEQTPQTPLRIDAIDEYKGKEKK